MIYDFNGITESTSSYATDFDIDAMLEDTNIVAAPEEDLLEATFRVSNEIERNWIKITEAACLDELFTFAESGDLEAVSEASIGGLFEKAKEFMRSIWKKIQEIFKNAIMWFSAKFGSNDAFYRKYKKALNSAVNNKSFSNLKFTGYTYAGMEEVMDSIDTKITDLFTNHKITTALSSGGNRIFKTVGTFNSFVKNYKGEKGVTDLEQIIKNDYSNDKITDKTEQARAVVVKEISGKSTSNTLTDKEFKDELDEYLKGSSSKESLEVTGSLISNAFNNLKKADKFKTSMDKCLRKIKKYLDDTIKELEDAKKGLDKKSTEDTGVENKLAGKKASLASGMITLDKNIKVIMTTTHGIILANAKAYAAQSRMLAAKAIAYNSKKFEESTSFTGGGSLLESVELI